MSYFYTPKSTWNLKANRLNINIESIEISIHKYKVARKVQIQNKKPIAFEDSQIEVLTLELKQFTRQRALHEHKYPRPAYSGHLK